MSEFEDKVNSILNDPQQMEKIAGLAKSLMGGEAQQSIPETGGNGMASAFSSLMGGDDIGFDIGEYVQEMYTIANDNPWGADANGKTRESLAARIPMDTAKNWVTVKFAVSQDFTSGNLFFVWGTNADGSAAAFTYISIMGANEDGFVAKIVDMDGYAVTELKANTPYMLVMSRPGTNVFKLANMVKSEMSVYFSASSIAYYDDDPINVEEPDVMPFVLQTQMLKYQRPLVTVN